VSRCATSYPPAPWRLLGDVYAAVLPIRRGRLTALVSPGYRLVGAAGWCPAVLVWAAYRPGGTLSYRELMLVLPVRRGWRLRATVARIWVDSTASRDGGRELWAIPKNLASIRVAAGSVHAADEEGRALADCSFRTRLRLPGRWPVRFALAQPDAGGDRIVALRGRGRVELGRCVVRIPPHRPLPELAGDRAIPAAALCDAVLGFGEGRWRRDRRRR
jgi:hypothetical protein